MSEDDAKSSRCFNLLAPMAEWLWMHRGNYARQKQLDYVTHFFPPVLSDRYRAVLSKMKEAKKTKTTQHKTKKPSSCQGSSSIYSIGLKSCDHVSWIFQCFSPAPIPLGTIRVSTIINHRNSARECFMNTGPLPVRPLLFSQRWGSVSRFSFFLSFFFHFLNQSQPEKTVKTSLDLDLV